MSENKKIIKFQEGIPGFENLKDFVLQVDEQSSFCYLQSVEQEAVCFVVVEPYRFKEDYTPNISETYFAKLGGGSSEEFMVYAIVTLGKTIQTSTINLQAPILIHVEGRMGVQAIVENENYDRRTKIEDLLEGRS